MTKSSFMYLIITFWEKPPLIIFLIIKNFENLEKSNICYILHSVHKFRFDLKHWKYHKDFLQHLNFFWYQLTAY